MTGFIINKQCVQLDIKKESSILLSDCDNFVKPVFIIFIRDEISLTLVEQYFSDIGSLFLLQGSFSETLQFLLEALKSGK